MRSGPGIQPQKNGKHQPIREEELMAFRACLLRYDAGSDKEKLQCLEALRPRPVQSGKIFQLYHDALLLGEAYAPNHSVYDLCRSELGRLAEISNAWRTGKDQRKRYALSGTGIAHSLIVGSFSFELIRWLKETFPDAVSMEGQAASELLFQDVAGRGLHPLENGLSEERNLSLAAWLKRSNAQEDPLQQLIRLFDRLPASPELRDLLYDSQKIYIQAYLDEPSLNRTFSRFNPSSLYFHDSLIRSADLRTEARKTLPRPLALSNRQRQELWTNARVTLFNLFRETDPVTFTDPDEIRWYPVGRGVGIALFFLRPEKRLPLDSYVGYVAYKNGLPQAYGGSWIFRGQAKIGINIFPAFRGGESSWLFAQLIRTYAQAFGVKVFAVEPYQIGKNNPEGIASGAFWFYYRHGFRPMQRDLAELASVSFEQISADRRYRTPTSVLRLLAASDLLLNLDDTVVRPFPVRYSRWMTGQFAHNSHGDRTAYVQRAIRFCRSIGLLDRLPRSANERRSLELLAPLIMAAFGPPSPPPNRSHLFTLRKWLTARYACTESEWLRLSNQCDELYDRLDRMLTGS
jgi:hypothetical protein